MTVAPCSGEFIAPFSLWASDLQDVVDSPTAFEVEKILPQAVQEWRLARLSPEQAAVRLAKRRAREILQSKDDPLRRAGDFDQMRVEAGYCKELAD